MKIGSSSDFTNSDTLVGDETKLRDKMVTKDTVEPVQ